MMRKNTRSSYIKRLDHSNFPFVTWLFDACDYQKDLHFLHASFSESTNKNSYLQLFECFQETH